MTIRWLPGPPRHPNVGADATGVFVGTFAGNKLDPSAVNRNRMRRRCREALRKAVLDRTVPTIQLMLSPKKKSLDCEWSEIVEDVEKFLNEIGKAG